MSAANNIEAVSVFVMVDGRLCLAPIPAESAPLLVGLIAPLQDGQPKETKLVVMPPSVAKHVEAAGKALAYAIKQRAGTQAPAGKQDGGAS